MKLHDVEEVIFVEFWPAQPRQRLVPFEVVTRTERRYYHWYDCAPMKDGTLVYHMSGFGGDGEVYVTRGPWWAASDVQVRHHGERRVRSLAKKWRTWPPSGLESIEAPIAECRTCGWLPDISYDEVEDPLCPHLRWNNSEQEWVQKRRRNP